MPVTPGEQNVSRFECAALAISLQKRYLLFVKRWKYLMMAAAACDRIADFARAVLAHAVTPNERARVAPY